MDEVRQAALARHALFAAAIDKGVKATVRALWRVRREALRDGELDEAAYWLGYLWSHSLHSPKRQLRLARMRAKEAPSTPSLLSLGHALMICGRAEAARRAYKRAIDMSVTASDDVRDLDEVMAEDAKHAIECLDQGRPIPFVKAVQDRNAPAQVRFQAVYEHASQRVRETPSAETFQNLGVAHEWLGRREEALKAYKRALAFAALENDEAVHESLRHKVRILGEELSERPSRLE